MQPATSSRSASPVGPLPAPAGSFFPALDGLRAVATVAVLISHFFPERSLIQRSFHWGRFGVLLFFVLSGFLITGLLLRGRDVADAGGVTRGSVFRAFVARRALRIAPIYYLVVLIGWWVGYGPIANLLPWHLTYTGNIALTYFHHPLAQARTSGRCVWKSSSTALARGHSARPIRGLVPIAVGLVLFSFGFEWKGTLEGRSFEQTHLVLQGCMDALGLGALLAIVGHRDGPSGKGAARLSLWASMIGRPSSSSLRASAIRSGCARPTVSSTDSPGTSASPSFRCRSSIWRRRRARPWCAGAWSWRRCVTSGA
jgi:peptidoglycan/LPS O-acetylase OafA/YrhL